MHAALLKRVVDRRRGSPFALDLHPGNAAGLLTFTGPAGRYYRDEAGVLRTVGANELRAQDYRLNPVTGVYEPAITLEGQRTNLVVQSGNLSVWPVSGTPLRTSGQPDPSGGSAAYLIEDDSDSIAEAYYMAIAFTSSGTKAAFADLKQGTSTVSMVGIYDLSLNTWRHRVLITWGQGGAPTVTTQTGAGSIYRTTQLANGYWRIHFAADAVVHTNEHRLYVYPTTFSGAATGTVYFAGSQTEDASFCTSAIPTGASTVTRTAETAYLDLASVAPALETPRESVHYTRWIEGGTIDDSTSRGVWQIGSGSRRILLLNEAGANGYKFYHFGGAGGTVSSAFAAPKPVVGDLVETVCVLYGSGVVQLHQRINGGAVASAVASPASTPPAAWDSTELFLGSIAGLSHGFASFLRHRVAIGLPGSTGQSIMDFMAQGLAA